jgi:formylmethanofuran dehydrogenase subunit E-like metal-binding protein
MRKDAARSQAHHGLRCLGIVAGMEIAAFIPVSDFRVKALYSFA